MALVTRKGNGMKSTWLQQMIFLAVGITIGHATSAVSYEPAPKAGGNSSVPRPTQPRIKPLARDEMAEEQQKLLLPFQQSGRVFNVFSTMAQHHDLARDWLVFAAHVLRNNTLPPRDREILILRIGWLCQAEYEWGHHVVIGKEAGLTVDDIRRIQTGPDAAGLSAHDRLLLAAVDELHRQACLSDETWKDLAQQFDTRQMMDLVFTVGQYNMVSMALNSFGVQLEDGFVGFEK